MGGRGGYSEKVRERSQRQREHNQHEAMLGRLHNDLANAKTPSDKARIKDLITDTQNGLKKSER